MTRDAVWGVFWAFLGTMAAKLSWLAALMFLTRRLDPAQFGLFAFGLVFITYVETVGDLGTGAALIYTPRKAEAAAQGTFLINLGMGLVWFTLAQLAAPAVAGFFQNPAGEPVIRILSISFLIKALGNTHDALCRKEMRFKARLVPEVGLAVGKAVLAVVLAARGLGVWSLVWAQLLGVAVWSAALWLVVPWRPRWSLARGQMVPLLRFGKGIVAVNVLAAVVHHADLVVVGRMAGATALGLYQVASRVPEMTVTLAVWVLGHVLFPAFSRLHRSGADLGAGFLAAMRWIPLLTLPAAAGLFLVAEPLVVTFFGETWRPAAAILQALAVYTGIRSLGSHSGDVLKATGRPGLLAGLGVLKALVLVPALILAGPLGAVAVAWTLAGVTVATVLLNLTVVSRLLELSWHRVARKPIPAVVATGIMIAGVVALQRGIPELHPALELGVAVITGIVLYVGVLLLVDRGVWTEAAAAIRGDEAGAGAPEPSSSEGARVAS
ncbi:MAG: lipopolysaccharide biosynthesis protein [Thermoanaerobaculia bacterium]|nr:lipopolysaccharide biosynthesis protein [Thermoanaerobaculia bacterium]